MTTEPNDAVLNFVIAKAISRAENYPGAIPATCEESVAIFDELDSLSAEEFAKVYALYLVGSGDEDNPKRAEQRALSARFVPLESMASDANLHVALYRGKERWHRFAEHS